MKRDKPEFIRRLFPTLEEMHTDWEANCIPPDAPAVQHKEMKKAFMSGVASLFHVMKFDIPTVTDDEGVGYMERIDAQLVQFFTKDIHGL